MRALARVACLAFGGALVVLVSCQAIVTTDVPAFTCTDNAGCPSGQYCKGAGCAACEATDVCDGLDNNCNGTIDEGNDVDEDGFTWCGTRDGDGRPQNADCDDNDRKIHPGADEVCNGIDDNCDGKIDDGVCQAGTTCIPTTGKCVVPCKLGTCPSNMLCDPETRECVNGTKQPPGGPCTAPSECDGLDRFYEGVLGTTVLQQTGKGICSKTCCTSADCPLGLVCYAPGTSGKYCVDPAKLGRPKPGNAGPGDTASRPEDCRSGLLEGTQCVDVCCIEADCKGGTHCTLGKVSDHTTFACRPWPGTKAQDDKCGGGGVDCRSSICEPQNVFPYTYTDRCIDACCGSAGCNDLLQGTLGDYATRCAYFVNNGSSEPFAICGAGAPSGPRTALGGGCGKNDDCRSGVCLNSLCSDVCCTDKDCASAGMRCKVINNLLRCSK